MSTITAGVALVVAATALGMAVSGCAGDAARDAGNATATADTAPAAAGGRPGVRFDPARAERGDTVAGLVIDSIIANATIVDSTHVGTAWFRGRARVRGQVIEHFDADVRDSSLCFEVDDASAARLPRWLHDERRSWFCFSNPEVARQALGGAAAGRYEAIEIDQFVIHRGLSDQVNAARFLRADVDEGGRQ